MLTNKKELVNQIGCLPNHICEKGVMKKIKDIYPFANIVAIEGLNIFALNLKENTINDKMKKIKKV